MSDWLRCRDWIEQALEHDPGGHTLNEVHDYLLKGEAHLWPGECSAAVTEWVNYPRHRVLNIWLMGGDYHDLFGPVLANIEAWAKSRGCNELYGGFYDRPGATRLVSRAGFQPRWTIFTKELP